MRYEKEQASTLAQDAIKAGYRAFIAESGNYGFYTDAAGDRVISFQFNGLEQSVSGNYSTNKPNMTGTGWRIADEYNAADLDAYFQASAPRWAVGDAKWSHTTLDQHLATYQRSSRYTEVTL